MHRQTDKEQGSYRKVQRGGCMQDLERKTEGKYPNKKKDRCVIGERVSRMHGQTNGEPGIDSKVQCETVEGKQD